jgi:hypothetical protein
MSDKALKLNGAIDEIEKLRREIAIDGHVLLATKIDQVAKELRKLARTCAHAYGEATNHRGRKR